MTQNEYNVISNMPREAQMTPELYFALQVSQQARRRAIRAFLQTDVWTEERLCAMLAHAQAGKLCFNSCCCLVGCANADHALMGENNNYGWTMHYMRARLLPLAFPAEHAYLSLTKVLEDSGNVRQADPLRRRILIPIIRAELRRRERLRQPAAPASTLELAVV